MTELDNSRLAGSVATKAGELLEVKLLLWVLVVLFLARYDRGGKCGVYTGFDLLGVGDVQR